MSARPPVIPAPAAVIGAGRKIAPASRNGAWRGVVLFLIAVAMFASMDVCTKLLVGGLPVPQIMWARFTFHFVGVALLLAATGRRLPWVARAPALQLVRSLTLASCNGLFAFSLIHVALAEATSINYAAPVITVAVAAVWLKERVAWRRWAGVAVGLGGVLIVLDPFNQVFRPAVLLDLGSATIFAFYHILTRRLAGVDTPQTTIFQTGMWATLATSAIVPFVWVWPDALDWAVLVMVGLLGGVSHFLLVLAYERAPASLLAPLGYSQLIWATLFGVALFGETPNLATGIGAAVIMAGGLLVVSSGAART